MTKNNQERKLRKRLPSDSFFLLHRPGTELMASTVPLSCIPAQHLLILLHGYPKLLPEGSTPCFMPRTPHDDCCTNKRAV